MEQQKDKINFLKINSEYCMSCRNCELACSKRQFEKDDKKTRKEVKKRIFITNKDKTKVPVQCRQCDNDYCRQVCPVGALKRENEVVTLDEDKCIGCEMCVQACPYGVITMKEVKSREKMVANKCDLCMAEQLNGENPACFNACPTKAIKLVSREERTL